MPFLPDSGAVYQEWRRIVVQYGVLGVQVHDARLVAGRNVHRVSHILTLHVSALLLLFTQAVCKPLLKLERLYRRRLQSCFADD